MDARTDKETVQDNDEMVAEKAQFRSWSIDESLKDILELLDGDDLNDDERQILERANNSLLNVQRILNQLRKNLEQ